ncbi:MAG: hypothetical protein ACI4OA_01160 [Selenomonadaceae bacterium]
MFTNESIDEAKYGKCKKNIADKDRQAAKERKTAHAVEDKRLDFFDALISKRAHP